MTPNTGTRPRKRRRRARHQLEGLRAALLAEAERHRPATVRQLSYRPVSAGVIPTTEQDYKNVVGRLLRQLRWSGRLPHSWIADNTRWQRKPVTWSSPDELLEHAART